jgi:hypothetical protein
MARRASPRFSVMAAQECNVLTIRDIDYGSIEIVVHDSHVVQIERKQKFRFDKP